MLVRLPCRGHGSVDLQSHAELMELLYRKNLACPLLGHDTVAIYQELFRAEGRTKPNFVCVKVSS